MDLIKKLQSSVESFGNYKAMLEHISETMPVIQASTESFNKASSQVKTISLDITDLTDVGRAKHLLARIKQRRQALQESEFTIAKKEIKILKLEKQLENASDLDAKEREIKIYEARYKIQEMQASQRGAVRELSFLVTQFKAILEKLGVNEITEAMYEADETKAQVMRAFSQALAAARARQGLIDEGNLIFFQDLGINGAAAQREVIALLETEQEMLNSGKVPTFELQYEWLERVGEKFSQEVTRYAMARSFVPFDEKSLAQKADSK